MATIFLSTANTLVPYIASYSSLSSSSSTATTAIYCTKHNTKRANSLTITLCKTDSETSLPCPVLTKRSLAICLTTALTVSFSGANAAILEADDDEELMEKVKKDRKKRLEKQGVINSSKKETAYLQDLVYKLSKVGQAIDNNDLSTASSVLGPSTEANWVQKVNTAFTKLSSTPEEKTQVDTFNASLASLISSVIQNDVESSKLAFVSSATALEKWTTLTGMVDLLKGL